tara:strand:- start:5753 stop:6499 length:747 start_codon:yes stop_codon:yes gene_type:complete
VEPVIKCSNVSKDFIMYHHFTGGIKSFLFNLPNAIMAMRSTRITVLEHIDLEIFSGETVGIIGKNGAGKSTILGLLAGVLLPSVGKVDINGRVAPLLELGAGFHNLLSGRENIILNGALLGMLKDEVNDKLEKIIEFSELEEFIDQPIRTYSSGMLARLGFSVAVNCDPDILLVDEVLAVGDDSFQKKCVEKMIGFKGQGKTIVFVSHNTAEIKQVCDRVVWIKDKKIKLNDYTEKVLITYKEDQRTT